LQLVVDGHATAFTTREFDDSLWRAILRAAEAEGPSIDIATAETAAEPLAGAEFTALRERAATLERTGQVAEAYFLYKLALAANPPKEADLRDHLGKMLSEGTGELAPDTPAAIAYFRAGAETGEVAAMTSYAFALHGGSGVPRDEAAGQRWFIEAAKAGAPDGNANVCLGYVHGNRLAEDAAMGADYCYEALVGGAQPVFDILSQLNQEGYVQPFRERLQQLLQDGGFYSGTIDGNFGPMSRAAVEAAFASGVEGEVEVEPAEQ
jgi:TPR repeat protein